MAAWIAQVQQAYVFKKKSFNDDDEKKTKL